MTSNVSGPSSSFSRRGLDVRAERTPKLAWLKGVKDVQSLIRPERAVVMIVKMFLELLIRADHPEAKPAEKILPKILVDANVPRRGDEPLVRPSETSDVVAPRALEAVGHCAVDYTSRSVA